MNSYLQNVPNYLDLLFKDRNKDYGAYTLRRDYNKRMWLSISIMLLVCIVLALWALSSNGKQATAATYTFVPPELVDWVDKTPPPAPVPIPPPVKSRASTAAAPIAATVFTPPVIMENNAVDPHETPPTQAEISVASIGVIKSDGLDIAGKVLTPPTNKGTGLAVEAQKTEKIDDGFTKIEVEARFPGGSNAWRRYLERNLQMPTEALENTQSGKVLLSFWVDEAGNISQINVLQDPGYGMAQEAIRIIKRGPKWLPAEQNGKKVPFRQTQQIHFVIQ